MIDAQKDSRNPTAEHTSQEGPFIPTAEHSSQEDHHSITHETLKEVAYKFGEEVEVKLGNSWKVGYISSLEPLMVLFLGMHMDTATECTLDQIRRYNKVTTHTTEDYTNDEPNAHTDHDYTDDEPNAHTDHDYTNDEPNDHTDHEYTDDEPNTHSDHDYTNEESTAHTDHDYANDEPSAQDENLKKQKEMAQKDKQKEEYDKEWNEESEDITDLSYDWIKCGIIVLLIIVVFFFIYQCLGASELPKGKSVGDDGLGLQEKEDYQRQEQQNDTVAEKPTLNKVNEKLKTNRKKIEEKKISEIDGAGSREKKILSESSEGKKKRKS